MTSRTLTRFSRVDYRGVAEVAPIAFTENRLAYGAFELYAPGIHSRLDLTTMLTAILGREIGFGTIDRGGLSHAPTDTIKMFAHCDHSRLLGSPLTSGRSLAASRAHCRRISRNWW